MPIGHTKLMPAIETAGAFFRAEEIAASHPRLISLTLGAEDFSASIGAVPDAEVMTYPKQHHCIAARAAGLRAFGVIGSGADYRDEKAFRELIRRSRRFGIQGSTCIHPAIVPLLNEGFSPTAEEIAHAERVVSAYETAVAEQRGSFSIDGKMIDIPIVERAQELLSIARRFGPESKFVSARLLRLLRISLPPGACDCHAHVYGPPERYPLRPGGRYRPPAQYLADYQHMLQRAGIDQAVIVQPTVYANNDVTADALAASNGAWRGVAKFTDSSIDCGSARDGSRRVPRRARPWHGERPRNWRSSRISPGPLLRSAGMSSCTWNRACCPNSRRACATCRFPSCWITSPGSRRTTRQPVRR